MKLNKVISTLAVLAFANVAVAEQDGFKISGDFATSIFSETGDRANGAYPSTGAVGVSNAAGVTNGNDDSFSIDQAELQIEKAMGNSSIHMGSVMVAFSTTSTTRLILQLVFQNLLLT